MAITKLPFRAESGFVSPGFSVSPTGDLTSINVSATGNLSVSQNLSITGNISTNGNLTVAGQIQSDSIVLNGIVLIDTDSTVLGLNTDIKESGLTKLGTLEVLQVNGDSFLKNSSNVNILTIVDGIITITSQSTGNIDNVIIGESLPTAGYFTEINSNNITVANTPTEPYHATRKDYVDTTIAALSIALGS
jgi:hypothetical protein